MVTVLRTGSDKFGEVWTSQNTCEALFFLNRESHAVQIWPTPKTCMQVSNRTSLEPLWPSKVVETALQYASVGVRCELVWSATFLRYTSKSDVVGKLSISWVRTWNFTRIGPQTKKVMAFNNSCPKAVWAARLGTTPKRWEPPLFLAKIRQAVPALESSQSRTLKYAVSKELAKDKKLQLFKFLLENKNFAWLSLMMRL